jgi:hypothetical protein
VIASPRYRALFPDRNRSSQTQKWENEISEKIGLRRKLDAQNNISHKSVRDKRHLSTPKSQDLIEMLSRVRKVKARSSSCLLMAADLGVKLNDRLVYVPLIQSG